MTGLIKIAGLSAALSASLVTADLIRRPRDEVEPAAKLYTDRVPQTDGGPARNEAPDTAAMRGAGRPEPTAAGHKGDSWREGSGCAAQAWPYRARECLIAADGAPARPVVRTITIESRAGANTSVLTRVPVADVAIR